MFQFLNTKIYSKILCLSKYLVKTVKFLTLVPVPQVFEHDDTTQYYLKINFDITIIINASNIKLFQCGTHTQI